MNPVFPIKKVCLIKYIQEHCPGCHKVQNVEVAETQHEEISDNGDIQDSRSPIKKENLNWKKCRSKRLNIPGNWSLLVGH
jgi:hypothetical protein